MYRYEDFRKCICEGNCLDPEPDYTHPQLICSCHYSKENNCTQCDNSKCLECQSLPDPYKHVREWENKRARKKRTIYLIVKYSGFNFVLKIINKLADYIFDSALPFVMRTIVYIASILFILYIIVFSTTTIYNSVTNWFADVRGESSESGRPYLVDENTPLVEPISLEEWEEILNANSIPDETIFPGVPTPDIIKNPELLEEAIKTLRKKCIVDADFIEYIYDQRSIDLYYYSVRYTENLNNPITLEQLNDLIDINEKAYNLVSVALDLRTGDIDSTIEDLNISESYIDAVLYGMYINTYDSLWARYQMKDYLEKFGPFKSNSEVADWYLLNESYSAVNWRKTDEYVDFIRNKLEPGDDYGNHIIEGYIMPTTPWILSEDYPSYVLREKCEF